MEKLNLINFFIILIEDGMIKNNIKSLITTEGKFVSCNSVENAISFMSENKFSYMRIIIHQSKAENFLKLVNDSEMVKKHGISISLLIVLDKEINKDKVNRILLPSTQCTKLCTSCNLAKIKCLQYAVNERMIIDFCQIPDQKMFYIRKVFGAYLQIPDDVYISIKGVTSSSINRIDNFNLPVSRIVDEKEMINQVYIDPNPNSLPFNDPQDMNDIYFNPIKYTKIICPSYFNQLFIPKKLQLDKLSVKVLSLIKYGKMYNVQNEEIMDWISELYIGEACWNTQSSNRHLIRCLLQYSRLFHLLNKTLDDPDEGLLYARYILLDLMNVLYSKQVQYFTGKAYKSTKFNEESAQLLTTLQGKFVFFNNLVIASKSEDNNPENNVTFIINTVTPDDEKYSEYHTNIDLLTFNRNEVLFPMMSIFKVESVEDEYGIFAVKLIQQIDNPYIRSLKNNLTLLNL
jgi:hypothetical protein